MYSLRKPPVGGWNKPFATLPRPGAHVKYPISGRFHPGPQARLCGRQHKAADAHAARTVAHCNGPGDHRAIAPCKGVNGEAALINAAWGSMAFANAYPYGHPHTSQMQKNALVVLRLAFARRSGGKTDILPGRQYKETPARRTGRQKTKKKYWESVRIRAAARQKTDAMRRHNQVGGRAAGCYGPPPGCPEATRTHPAAESRRFRD